MKLKAILITLFFTGVNISCSAVYNVSYDVDDNFNSAQFSTYDWLPIPDDANINNIDEVRIKKTVNAELQAKGLELTSENPNFLIAAYIVTKEKLRITEWGYPFFYSHRFHHRSRFIEYHQYEEGTFILNFIESLSKKLIWHGAAKVALEYADTPEKRDVLIEEAMQKILQNYPPPPK